MYRFRNCYTYYKYQHELTLFEYVPVSKVILHVRQQVPFHSFPVPIILPTTTTTFLQADTQPSPFFFKCF